MMEDVFRLKKDGDPCDHLGCLAHASHPCEGCGRIAGKIDPAARWLIERRIYLVGETMRREFRAVLLRRLLSTEGSTIDDATRDCREVLKWGERNGLFDLETLWEAIQITGTSEV